MREGVESKQQYVGIYYTISEIYKAFKLLV